MPLLVELFLPKYCTLHHFMHFIPDQCVYIISLCETCESISSMFIDTFDQIGGYAYVKCTIAFAGKKIDAGLFAHAYDLLFVLWIPAIHAGMTIDDNKLDKMFYDLVYFA